MSEEPNYLEFQDIVRQYSQYQILNLADKFPNIQEMPIFSEMLDISLSDDYSPLALIGDMADFIRKAKDSLLSSHSCETLDELETLADESLSSRYTQMDAPDGQMDYWQAVYDFQNIFSYIIDLEEDLNREYSLIAAGAKNFASEMELEPCKALANKDYMDEIIRYAFPKSQSYFAEWHLKNILFHYRMLNQLTPLKICLQGESQEWKNFEEMLDNLPVDDLENLLDIGDKFARHEHDRIYYGVDY